MTGIERSAVLFVCLLVLSLVLAGFARGHV